MDIQRILRRSLLFLWTLTAAWATTSWAIPVSITIEPHGTLDGFRYSVIHTASHESGSYPGYYPGGSIVYANLTGTLSGALTGSPGHLTLSDISGVLTADIVGSSHSATLAITSGSLAEQPSGLVDGQLSYILTAGPTRRSGTFYVDAINFMNNGIGPNRLSRTRFVLWGNNWNVEDGESKPVTDALGMDLKGSIQAVPEPSTLLLTGIGLAGFLGWRYWQSRR